MLRPSRLACHTSRVFYFAVGYSRAPSLSSGQFQSSVVARAATACSKTASGDLAVTFGRQLSPCGRAIASGGLSGILHHDPSSFNQPGQRLTAWGLVPVNA